MRPEREAAHRGQTGDRSANQDFPKNAPSPKEGKQPSAPALPREDKLPEALRRLRLPELARALGLQLPESSGPCRSPFREDRKPSFSWFVAKDGRDRWKDFATGRSGDAVDFLAEAKGLSSREALPLFLELAGLGAGSPLPRSSPAKVEPARRRWKPPADKVSLPEGTRTGEPEDRAKLCESRGWDPLCTLALKDATEAGFLRFATYQGEACWLLVDPALRFFEARRMDALDFEGGGKSRARGSKSLLGPSELGPSALVLLTEGAPDFLAAHFLRDAGEQEGAHLLGSCSIFSALGANGGKLSQADLERLRGAKVLAIPHRDEAGETACREWKRQLLEAGCAFGSLDLSPFLPPGGKDLADCLDPLFPYGLIFKAEGELEKLTGRAGR